MRPVLIIAVLAVLSAGGYFGYERWAGAAAGTEYITKPIDRGDIVQTVSATGTIEPITKVIVGSQVSGNIKKWNADFNRKVTKGFVLAEIDPDRFQTTYDRALADVATAKAREEELEVRAKDAQREYKRLAALDTQSASENELLIAKAAAEAAVAMWHGAIAGTKSAQASFNSAKVDLDHTIISSPIDGVVISRDIDVGQTVAASMQAPQLFLIANNLAKMQVNANVSEGDVGLIKEGKPATFRVDAYPKRTFEGIISQIRFNPTTVDGVVTYITLIEVHNDDLALRPGMTANVTFEVARASNVLRVPNAALRFTPAPTETNSSSGMAQTSSRGPKTPTVWLTADGRPRRVEVKTGLSDGAFTEAVSGDLREGQRVITERNWLVKGGGGSKPDPSRTMRPGRM